MLRQVEERLELEHKGSGRPETFQHLKQFIAGDGSGESGASVAESRGISEGAVKVAVHRLRKRFRMVLRDEIAQTVVDPSEVDEELRHLYAALAGG